jgi:hypothetical protein
MVMIGKVNYYLVRKRLLSGCPLVNLLNYDIKESEELNYECN